MGWEDEKGYLPFIYIDTSSEKLEGYFVNFINLVFKDSEAKVEYELLPCKRCLLDMTGGDEMDIVLATASTEERRKYINFLISQPRLI